MQCNKLRAYEKFLLQEYGCFICSDSLYRKFMMELGIVINQMYELKIHPLVMSEQLLGNFIVKSVMDL